MNGRPSDELMQRLRSGKQELHRSARALPLQEKVLRVIELQRLTIPLIARRRPLRQHERVWGEPGDSARQAAANRHESGDGG